MVEMDGALVDGQEPSQTDHRSPGMCCSFCKETAGCVAFLWTNSTDGTNLCYLKKELKDPKPADECHVYGTLKDATDPGGGLGIGGLLAAVCVVLLILLLLVLLVCWAIRRRKERNDSDDSEMGLSRPLSAEIVSRNLSVPPTSILKASPSASVPQQSPMPSAARELRTVHASTGSQGGLPGSIDLQTSLGAAREAAAAAYAAAASTAKAANAPAGASPLGADASYAEKLREVQQMLDDADPDEFVGLAVQVHDEKAVVTERVGGRFRVTLDSGGEVMLDKIEATHVVDWLDGAPGA